MHDPIDDITLDNARLAAAVRRQRQNARTHERIRAHQRRRRKAAASTGRREQRAPLARRALWWLAAFGTGSALTHVALLLAL